MKNLIAGKASILVLTAAAAVSIFLLGKSLTTVFATAGDVPKAYCHAAGQAGTLHFNYHYNKAWTSHFDDNGTPKAGHESDFYTVIGDRNCDGQPDSTPTPTASPTGSPEPTPNPDCEELKNCPTPIPSASPEATPTPEITDACPNLDGIQEDIPDGYHYDNDFVNCLQYQLGGPPTGGTSTGGQVLGASTMAGTGTFDENLYMVIMTLGGIITSLGVKSFVKALKRA